MAKLVIVTGDQGQEVLANPHEIEDEPFPFAFNPVPFDRHCFVVGCDHPVQKFFLAAAARSFSSSFAFQTHRFCELGQVLESRRRLFLGSQVADSLAVDSPAKMVLVQTLFCAQSEC